MSSDTHPPAVPFGVKSARARKMLSKNLKLLRDLAVNLDPTHGQRTLRRNVAALLSGEGSEARPTATIDEGGDNLSLTILSAEGSQGGPRKLFLEKKTHNRSDYRVARRLAGSGSFTLLPEVYAANARPTGFLIYTDYLEDLESFAPDRDGYRTLAQAAVRLSKDLARFPGLAERQPYFEYGWKGLHHHLVEACGVTDKEIQKVLSVAGKLPLVMCHNDLTPDNIHLHSRGGSKRVTFVDMGSIKANFPGAELHPFASAADMGGDAGFLRKVAGEYSELSGVAEREVLFAAHLYAGSVALRNSINKLRADPYVAPALHFQSALRHLPR